MSSHWRQDRLSAHRSINRSVQFNTLFLFLYGTLLTVEILTADSLSLLLTHVYMSMLNAHGMNITTSDPLAHRPHPTLQRRDRWLHQAQRPLLATAGERDQLAAQGHPQHPSPAVQTQLLRASAAPGHRLQDRPRQVAAEMRSDRSTSQSQGALQSSGRPRSPAQNCSALHQQRSHDLCNRRCTGTSPFPAARSPLPCAALCGAHHKVGCI